VASIYTRAQIVKKIQTFDEAIEALAFAQTYSIDTGQGRQSITRASLPQLRKERDRWQAELDTVDGRPGFVSIEAGR
jgi:hypothetical protein